MLKSVVLTQEEPFRIQLNPFVPFLNIVEIEHNLEVGKHVSLYLETRNKDSTDRRLVNMMQGNEKANAEIANILQSYYGKNVSLSIKSDQADVQVVLKYSLINNFVDIANPITRFAEHLENPVNERVVFSAPFGQGKTTFLNSFFQAYHDVYEVFEVFPVNYSVASNEDVFKYIKCDILFQLLAMDVDFDFYEMTTTWAATEFTVFHPKKLILNFLRSTAQIDKRAAAVFKGLENLYKAIEKYKSKEEIDDRTLAIKYVSAIYEEEGSLYEDNLLTQLIRSLLEQLKTKSNKENVLIIEDLDRIDPDHVFRILNVISAHYDTNKYSPSYLANNKFGFDKIITVCDKSNIKSVFRHRFGQGADFSGYFNKFYSVSAFDFSNEDAIAFHIDMIGGFNAQELRDSGLNDYFVLAKKIIHDLVKHREMTLRDLIKFSKVDFLRDAYSLVKVDDSPDLILGNNFYLHLYLYMNHIDGFKSRIERVKNKRTQYTQLSLDYFIQLGLMSRAEKKKGLEVYTGSYEGNSFQFEIIGHRTAYTGFTGFKFINAEQKYDNQMFYEVFIENMNYFDSHK